MILLPGAADPTFVRHSRLERLWKCSRDKVYCSAKEEPNCRRPSSGGDERVVSEEGGCRRRGFVGAQDHPVPQGPLSGADCVGQRPDDRQQNRFGEGQFDDAEWNQEEIDRKHGIGRPPLLHEDGGNDTGQHIKQIIGEMTGAPE